MNNPTGKISEIVVRVDGQPVYSGTKMGASVALHNALTRASVEGRSEPEIRITERVVDYDLLDQNPDKVVETEIIL